MQTCKHRKFWIIGMWFWCYQCGAVRKAKLVSGNAITFAEKHWTKPAGPKGENPALKEKV